jgi:NADPH2:quinone reductase
MYTRTTALPCHMRSIVYSRTGSSSVLSLAEREPAMPGPGEVRVKVAVSGVNPTDWKARAGSGAKLAFDEIVPNQDGAGVIDAVGDGVAELAVGDRVWLYLAQHERPTGTAQEYTVVPAERAVKLPDDMGFDVAASLGVPAMTAHRALTVHEFGPARLSPGSLDGRIVLVAGGAGAVGHAAIQLAAWAGATVITTVSSEEKAVLARRAGAHHIVNYRDADAADQIAALAPDGVDHIVEVAIAQNAALDAQIVANHGSIAYYATDGGRDASIPVWPTFAKNVRIQGLLLYTVGEAALSAAAEDITAALGDRALPVGEAAGLPLTWFTLEQTAAAHDAVEQGAVGKVLIDVSGDNH